MKQTDWNRLAEEYTRRDFPRKDWIYGYQPVLDLLVNIMGKRILDYGCGSGKFARVLAKRGAEVIAVDSNEKMLALARDQDCQGIIYQRVTDNELTHVGSVDGAVATYVICTRKEDEEVLKIIQQVYRMLPNAASFIILDPHPNNRQGTTAGAPLEIYLEGMDSPVFDYWRPIEKYLSLFQETGFNIDNVLQPEDEEGKPQMLIIKGIKCTD